LIPGGISEKELVAAMWSEATGKWIMLTDGTVQAETDTITVPISHFSTFTVLAYARPATLVASGLSIAPVEVDTGEEVTISFLVTNTGDLNGRREVTLRIDNAVVSTQGVTLEGDASEQVVFIVAREVAGMYEVAVAGLSGRFVVKGAADFVISGLSVTPAEVYPGDEIIISAFLTNTSDVTGSYKVDLRIDGVLVATREVTLEGGASEEATFTTTKEAAGTYAIIVDGLSGTFLVRMPPEPVNRWLVGGIIAAGIATLVVIALIVVWYRRRT